MRNRHAPPPGLPAPNPACGVCCPNPPTAACPNPPPGAGCPNPPDDEGAPNAPPLGACGPNAPAPAPVAPAPNAPPPPNGDGGGCVGVGAPNPPNDPPNAIAPCVVRASRSRVSRARAIHHHASSSSVGRHTQKIPIRFATTPPHPSPILESIERTAVCFYASENTDGTVYFFFVTRHPIRKPVYYVTVLTRILYFFICFHGCSYAMYIDDKKLRRRGACATPRVLTRRARDPSLRTDVHHPSLATALIVPSRCAERRRRRRRAARGRPTDDRRTARPTRAAQIFIYSFILSQSRLR